MKSYILKEIDELSSRVAAQDYSRQEYERYKKLHPKTKKKITDPLFQLKKPSSESSQPEAKPLPVKNDHFSLFNKTPDTTIVPVKSLQHRPSPADAESRSLQYAHDTLAGKYQKRDPLSVWKVVKPDGSHYYSVRDGNTTLQMLKNQGWDSMPVHVEKEVKESELTPVDGHVPKNKPLTEKDLADVQQTVKGKKLKEAYLKKKKAIHAHLKKEIGEFASAGTAIKKFVNKEALTEHEKEAVKEASKKVASMFISMTLGGHVGVSALAEHIAVEQVVESAAASHGDHGHHAPEHDPIHDQPATEETITKLNFKGLGAKVKKVFGARKEAITHHLKNKAGEFKKAGSAIKKFVKGEALSETESHALKSAAKEVAAAVIFAAVGHSLALASVAKYFAIGAISQAAVATLPKRKATILNEIEGLMSKIANRDEQDVFIEMIIESVTKQLGALEGYTPQQLRDLAKQLQRNVEKDPKLRRQLEQEFQKQTGKK